MNTIKSGKILLNKYNKVHNTHLNAKEFFCTIVAPLLFYGEKHLVYWMNSKFSNASGSWVKSCKNKTYNMELLNTTLEEFCAPIDNPVHNVLTTLNVFGGSCIPDPIKLLYKFGSYCLV